MADFNYEIIEQFDGNEKLWLLGDVITQLGSANEELSDGSIEAAEEIKKIPKREQIENLVGICFTKFSDDESLAAYADGEFTDECIESWGEHLEKLSYNDATWIVYCAIYAAVNAAQLSNRDLLDELAGSIENGALSESGLEKLALELCYQIIRNEKI